MERQQRGRPNERHHARERRTLEYIRALEGERDALRSVLREIADGGTHCNHDGGHDCAETAARALANPTPDGTR